MSGVNISYPVTRSSHTVDSTLGDSKPIPYGDFTSGLIIVPSGSSITSFTFYGSTAEDGTYVQIYDDSNVAVSLTVAAARSYRIPLECLGVPWLKLVPNADGTVNLCLKS